MNRPNCWKKHFECIVMGWKSSSVCKRGKKLNWSLSSTLSGKYILESRAGSTRSKGEKGDSTNYPGEFPVEIKKQGKKKFFTVVSSLLTRVGFGDEWVFGVWGGGRGCLFVWFFPFCLRINEKEMAHASVFNILVAGTASLDIFLPLRSASPPLEAGPDPVPVRKP